MIFKNAMSFKEKIKQVSKEKNISPQQVQQCYLIEAFLEKLAKSEYKNNFILKGGFLIGRIVGLDERTTKDLDTTIKGIEMTAEKLTNITKSIIEEKTDESFTLSFESICEIRENDESPGFKLKLYADFERIHELVSIDVTSGDAISPREIVYKVNRLFSNDYLSLLAYPLETILAEKIETILTRGVASTRPRDYYDVYILQRLGMDHLNLITMAIALKNTMDNRKSNFSLENFPIIIDQIKHSKFQQQLWRKYQDQYNYAEKLSFQEVMDSVMQVLMKIVQ